MNRTALISLLLLLAGCDSSHSIPSPNAPSRSAAKESTVHPQVDFDHWARVFPIETFEKTDGPRQFDSTEAGDPLDLWKPQGQIITSPAHLCEVELVRKRYAKAQDLGPAVPVDIFLWSIAPPEKPYLTKLGGVPHREAGKAWPTADGKPFTFVGQFCFIDSRDIISDKLPDDVMLIFFKDADSIYEGSVHIEWSSIDLQSPVTAEQCPEPGFAVPRLSGHIYRTNEYPESGDVFEQADHHQSWLFPTTQSTKIGRESFSPQHDPRNDGEELLCTLNSVHPKTYPPGAKWPFIGLETLPKGRNQPDNGYNCENMMFGDVGCIFFVINKDGRVRWSWDCY